MAQGTHNGSLHGKVLDGDHLTMRWHVWCRMRWCHHPLSWFSTEEGDLDIEEVHEAEIEVYSVGYGTVTFYLYDEGSLRDFLELWGVDLDDALANWEPDYDGE